MSEAISAMQAARRPFKDYHAHHFRFEASEDGRVATVRLDRPERKIHLPSTVMRSCAISSAI